MGRQLGWIPDVADARDYSASALFGAVRGLSKESTLLRAHAEAAGTNDQVGGSCVGQALEKAIDVRLRHLGHSISKRSAQAIYTGARRYESESDLVDEGCQPRNAMKFIRDVGVASEEAWASDGSRLNDEIDFEVLRDASKLLVFEWYRLQAKGVARADQVAQSLSKGIPVVFGSELDRAFFEYAGGILPGYGPEQEGGHMLCLLDYRHDERGRRQFLGINSWGYGWGERGFFWIGDDRVSSPRSDDFHAIVVSP